MFASMRRVPVIAIAVACLCSTAALAEEATSNVLEEIVVTAEKRTEKLQDVPLAVTVVGEAQLQSEHIYSIADLARTAPSLEMVQAFGGPGGGGQIRGVGTNSFTRSAEGAVGIVVDGVPQGNVNGNNIYDLARVEVLRGPQGTLFGLTSSAGVINMVTVAPDPSGFHANVHVDYSNNGTAGSKFGEQTVRGAVNVPVTENSALRISANGDFVKGVQRNAFNGVDDYAHDGAVRVRYLWKSDTFTVNLIADYDRRTQNYDDPRFSYVYVRPGSPLVAELAACGIVADYANQSRCSSLPNNSDRKNTGLSAQIDWNLPVGTLTSITGYRRLQDLPTNADIEGMPTDAFQIFDTNGIDDSRQVSEELRLSSPSGATTEYTTGLFYSDYHHTEGFSPGGGFFVQFHPAPGLYFPVISSDTAENSNNRGYAAFGQLTHHVTSQFALIGGLRYTAQTLDDVHFAAPNTPPDLTGATTQANFSGKVGVQYKFSPDMNIYASYTRGYKGPQIITASQGIPPTKIAAEIPNAYELGLKGALSGGSLGYDVSVFYSNVHDYQGQRCIITPFGSLSCVGESIPSVITQGVELELFGKPIQGLSLNAGLIYDDAKYPSGWTGFNPDNLLPNAAPTNLGGLQIVGVPKTKFTLSGEYSHALGGVEGYLGGDTVYKSDMRMGPSGDPRYVYPAHWILSLRLGVRGHDDRWSVELFARNLNDQHEPATLFGGPSFVPPGGLPPPFSAPPGSVNGISGWQTTASLRQVGLSAEMRW